MSQSIKVSVDSSRTDLSYTVALMCVYALLTFPALNALEFFRHTEADRSLIALEMARSGEYLIPHLLGSVILTKPPLFYWLVASSISLFGSFDEWILRFPSALFAVLYVGAQFLFCRILGWSRLMSLLSAAALGTSILFVTLSLSAEIDMTFGFLSAVALYLYCYASNRRSIFPLAAAYAVAALAFLVKGPPIIGFMGAAILFYYIFEGRSKESLPSFVLRNVLGAVVFLCIAALWPIAVSEQIGWSALYRAFEVEVLERVVEESTRKHGVFFYLGQAVAGAAPWSILGLLGFAVLGVKSKWRMLRPSAFTIYNLCVVIPAAVMLSLAEGKSARYLFPVYPFLINLSLIGMLQLQGSTLQRLLYRVGKIFFPILLVASLVAPFLIMLPGVERTSYLLPALTAVVVSLIGIRGCYRSEARIAVGALLGVMFVVQLGTSSIYAPYRNATCSVKGMSEKIAQAVPDELPIYTVEMFERWVVYYLVRGGREVYRLDAARIREAQKRSERVYILLSFLEERWRLSQLRYYDETLKEEGEFSTDRDHLLLISVDPKVLPYLEPLPYFPTVPSYPFYAEVKFQLGEAEPR